MTVSYCETGEIRIYALFCGGDKMDMAVFDPFDPNVGTKMFNPYFAYLITHPRGNVLFDTAGHPDLRTNPRSRLGNGADAFDVVMQPEDWVVPRLAELELRPEDIPVVVQSHLHFDHAGALEWFKHAEIFLQKPELEFARNPAIYQRAAYVRADFEHDLNWHLIEGEYDLFGDGTLLLVPTPGHTPGHQSLLVRSGPGRSFFLLADATYLVAKMRQRALPGLLWNPDAMVESWLRIEEIERDEGAALIATHELDFESGVPKSPSSWYS
ncbi:MULTISPECIES: N-acyl homoserine lactonase family protein [unclassified Bradyrhizobium]|uniref:N-acyl homoserine lactonase family protein n=1 Tax=Bradyrhizobium sp. USDA 4541 TaxID=2817704 RepID=UPI0020A4FFB9|nr:N-acyl homoserine lactonase family protein [Bradyrhizobium sp. USDA 4541]MCP1848142.1 glyoxylase-like metal-dependent hydrolase (beta-lactamase superfamily II) [Bradyrhizobium sp. USDA 4541]